MERIFGKIVYIIVACMLVALAISQAGRRPGPCPFCGHDRQMEGLKVAVKAP